MTAFRTQIVAAPPPSADAARAGPNDLFHFHPRATNPELWRTTVPLVVRARCGRHKGLIATWTAIHWLIVLHAASGRAHFGVREIAEEAGVGRNELAGEGGYIQRLVRLGLIRIVGHRHFRGLREPRPVYHIDLAELERLSLDLVPEVLREHHVDRPPPATPDPRQLPLFSPGPTRPDAQAGGGPAAPEAHPPGRGDGTADGADAPIPARGRHEGGTAPAPAAPAAVIAHETGTAARPKTPFLEPPAPKNGTDLPLFGLTAPDSGRTAHQNVTVIARNRDVDGMSDRRNEGGSQPPPPDVLQLLAAQVTQAVLATLQAQGSLAGATPPSTPPALTVTPPAPAGAEPLPASVLALWQGDEPTVSKRALHQLALIAAEADPATNGHGAYWLGRAILMADLCLGDPHQARSLPYLRGMLRRWREEGSWGSDRAAAEPPRPVSEPPARKHPSPEPPGPVDTAHPAVAAYIAALHETPNAVQADQIAQTVTDLDAWRQVLREWQLNGWGERSVGKMLDRYQKSLPAAAEGPAPSVGMIHTYPGLTPEQRDRWIKRFHAAATPAEKRAVLARLEQEHPR